MAHLTPITPADLAFLSAQEEHWEAVREKYTKNLDLPFKEKMEALYKKYIDPKFILDRNCRDCNFKMLQGLMKLWEANMPTATLEGGEIVVKVEDNTNGSKNPETQKK